MPGDAVRRRGPNRGGPAAHLLTLAAFYGTAIRRVFGPAALYAQVIKTRRHDRVVRVERRAVIGAAWRFAHALSHSEDSSTVNTSFIERLNLTIRQSSAYLSRRTLAHARVLAPFAVDRSAAPQQSWGKQGVSPAGTLEQ